MTNVTENLAITANFANSAPTANAQILSTPENQATAIILTGSDPEGSGLSYAVATLPVHGTLSGTAPNLTYTPTTGYVGTDAFTFTVTDGMNSSLAATISIAMSQMQKTVTFTSAGNGIINVASTQTVNWSGSTIPVTATANSGYHFVNWTGTGDFVTTTSNPLVVSTVTSDMVITANFANSAPTANSRSVTTPENQAVAISLSGNDPEGSNLSYTVTTPPLHGSLSGTAPTLTYTPAAGYAGSDSFAFTVSDGINSSVPETISITLLPYTVTVPGVVANGIISPSLSQTVHFGSVLSFQVTPDIGYSIGEVTGCGGTLSGGDYTTAAITGDCSVSVTFVKNIYTVTASIPGGNGGVSCTPAITYYGTSAICTITPASNYLLSSLTDNGIDVSPSANAASYTISDITTNHSLAATFSLKKFFVTVNAGIHGTSTPNINQSVLHGNTISFQLLPDAGYHIVTPITSSCGGTLTGSVYTSAPITADCSITTEYAVNQYTVNAFSGSGGSISPGTQEVQYGKTTSFTVTPSSGYFTGPVSGCGGTLAGDIYTTGLIKGDCSISATFITAPVPISTGKGIITCSKPAVAGDNVNCLVTPDKGYHLSSLTDNDVSVLTSVTNKYNYSLAAVTAPHTIKASFAAYSLADALRAIRIAVGVVSPTTDEYLWLDVAPLDASKPKSNGTIDILDALVLLKHSIGSYTEW